MANGAGSAQPRDAGACRQIVLNSNRLESSAGATGVRFRANQQTWAMAVNAVHGAFAKASLKLAEALQVSTIFLQGAKASMNRQAMNAGGLRQDKAAGESADSAFTPEQLTSRTAEVMAVARLLPHMLRLHRRNAETGNPRSGGR